MKTRKRFVSGGNYIVDGSVVDPVSECQSYLGHNTSSNFNRSIGFGL